MLSAGTQLGPYEVVGLLAAGGMGEVYRARDPRLGREVAIKVLPEGVNDDPDRLRRFEQEARAAGGLNHPNILAIHDVGVRDGAPYVVSELLDGETLSARLRAGALALRDAIGYATQIAQGLAAAHEKGIVHRDLKPENLFVTKDGRVKILDFGLAKLSQPERLLRETGDAVAKELTTVSGTILGTIGYMSPEQVRGHPVDHRSDVFSYGAVLYEMLCGRRAFQGETPADTLTAILRQDPPDLSGMGREIPSALERITRRCLERDPAERFQSAQDIGFALEAVRDAGLTRPEAATLRRPGRRARFAAAARAPRLAVGAVAGLLAVSLLATWSLPPPTTLQITRSTQLTFTGGVGAPDASREWFPAIFTDGTRVYFSDYSRQPGPALAYVSRGGGEVVQIPSPVERSQLLSLSPDGGRLLVREWLNPVQTEGALWIVPTSGSAPKRLGDVMAHDAAWSPDGQSLVYARAEELYVSSGDGGKARRLATTPGRVQWIRWSPDGRHLRFTLIDAKGHRRSLWQVSADGTDLHVLPFQWDGERPQECCGEWSRDGRHFVFTAVHEQGAGLWIIGETGRVFRGRSWKPTRLTSDSFYSVAAIPSVDGKELYAVETRGTLQALQYDPRSRQLTAFPISNALVLRFSRDGQWLVYVEVRGTRATLKRSRRDGSQALELTDPSMEIWTPRWSPDGKQIAFSGKRPGQPYKAYIVSRDGDLPQQVLGGERNEIDLEWSPDGRSLMFGRPPDIMAEAGSTKAIHMVDLETKQVSTLPRSEGLFGSRWSPDGRYVVAAPLDCRKLVIFDFQTAEWSDFAGPGIGVGFEGACRPACNNAQWSPDGRYVYVESGTNVIRVALADRRVERVLGVSDLGPTVKDFGFDGLTPDGSVLLATGWGGSDIHALELRAP
jgi:Tol biopolymer transport system component